MSNHIAKLKNYNEVRDIAIGLVNHLAGARQCTAIAVINDLDAQVAHDF